MAITPDTYDMTIQRSSDHSLDFELKDSTGSAVSFATNAFAIAQAVALG